MTTTQMKAGTAAENVGGTDAEVDDGEDGGERTMEQVPVIMGHELGHTLVRGVTYLGPLMYLY